MRYNLSVFNEASAYYAKKLREGPGGKAEGRVVFVVLNLEQTEAFFSIAPLSRAVHSLRGDMHVMLIDESSSTLDILKDVWGVYSELDKKNREVAGGKKKIRNKETEKEQTRTQRERAEAERVKALKNFITAVGRRTKTNYFGEIFKGPDILLNAGKNGFSGVNLEMEYRSGWHENYRQNELIGTCSRIWKQGYDLKKGEKVGVSFVLVPSKKNTELPLEDYLDSYSIAMAMALAAKRFKVKLRMGSYSDKFSLLAKPVRTAELVTTLRGCELSKDVDEEVFKEYKKFSALLNIRRMDNMQASFGIHAKGYYGKHFFGDSIGYPSLDKKTRWSSPGQLMLKDRYEPQTALEKREPMMRYAITESLPIDIFIETCNLDYNELRNKSKKIRDIFNKCSYIRVVGAEPLHFSRNNPPGAAYKTQKLKSREDGGAGSHKTDLTELRGGGDRGAGSHKTDLTISLESKDGRKRLFTAQDSDVRTIIDREYYKKTKIKAGSYANFPSGESFVTPEAVYGTMVGDVVINVDRSYVIPGKSPILIKFTGSRYKVISAPKKIEKAMVKTRNEARKRLNDLKKSKSLPKEVIEVYEKNFWNIGEFAVNTNPKARLCDYLIVNEKIAGMLHLALGSGFESDRKTLYHWDIVVNAPKQKLDVYGVDKNKKLLWVLKKGKFVA